MKFFNRLLTVGCVIFLNVISINSKALAQETATVRGFVYEKETGEPMLFTTVFLKGTTYAASTDVNGYYTLSKVKPGKYILVVTNVGFDTTQVPIVLLAGDIITKKLTVEKRAYELATVDISADKQEARTEVRIGVSKVTPRELKQIPTVGGEPDIAQYLQTLPGVVSTGDQGGQLYIRGGSPIQNKVLLDGMTIYNPFHSIGLFSVFETEIIRSAEVYTGGFNAQYGDRISSVIDIKTRDGNKKRISGKISASPFMSKAILEGPIFKQIDEDKGSSSFIVTGKTSYLDRTSKKLYNYGSTKDIGIPFSFTDLYGKASINSANGSKISLFGFNFADSVFYKSPVNKNAQATNIGWRSMGAGANFVIIPGGSSVLIDGIFAYSRYAISDKESNNRARSSSIDGFNMGLNFTSYSGDNEVKYGFSVQAFNTSYDYFIETLNRMGHQVGSSTEAFGYLKYKFVFGKKWVIEPGLHVHYYASLAEFSPEPRLGLKLNVNDRLRLKFAGGLYSQNLITTTSDLDVVNLFSGFLTGPENVGDGKGNPVDSRLQKAAHAILGFEYDLAKHLDLNVEAYVKDFYQLTNLNRNKIYDSDPDFTTETGLAQGIDFALKYDYKQLMLSATYSLSSVKRQFNVGDSVVEYYTNFDRRHNLGLLASYTFGKGYLWQFDVRWNYGSAFPFTKTTGYYAKDNLQGNPLNYPTNNAQLGYLYGAINTGRLSDYHRLDMSLKRRFELGKNTSMEANISVTNVYNRSNIFYVDKLTNTKIYQLPILPSMGLSLTF